ncbi:MAG TPA: class I SAM-dependent methyltransferase [Solirubrobacterales bacterium]
MNGRLAAALRALRGEAAEPDVAPDPLVAASDVDPVDRAIATLRETPIAEIQQRGYHFQPRDYYSALNDLSFLEQNSDLWHHRGMPAAVDWNLDGQLELLRQIAPLIGELEDIPDEMAPGDPSYHWRNDFWSGPDAGIHYGMLRNAKPRRVVEIGCGWSSLLMARALARNEAEGAPQTAVDQIEPYARKELLRALPEHWDLHEAMLQRAPLEPFERLGAGDVCFYDGSHVARAGSDVNWFFFEVVPRLAPGVLLHVHDIFWPSDYPDQWIFERGQTWNEQYVLQAFLMYNREFEPLACTSALVAAFPEEVQRLLVFLPTVHGGGSVWLRRR